MSMVKIECLNAEVTAGLEDNPAKDPISLTSPTAQSFRSQKSGGYPGPNHNSLRSP